MTTDKIPGHFSVLENGHLAVGGVDTLDLAREYGTPLYAMDEGAIRQVCRAYQESIRRFYGGRGLALYASKAFCCKEICRVAASEGMGLDVVSSGELYTALEAGFPMEKVYFHGNNKTAADLAYAVESDVGHIVVDNLEELARLGAVLRQCGKTQSILLRLKPGVDAHTHQFVRTGQIDSKFGFAIETGEALKAARTALDTPGVRLAGIHCHIGSQIFDTEPFCHAADVMVHFMGEVHRQMGVQIEQLNLGGGFGIRYVERDDPVPYERYMELVSGVIRESCIREGIEVPFVLLEPGRSVVGDAGLTLYTVGAKKEIPGVRTYVSVDGGMTDNPRYALYQSAYEAVVAARANAPKTMRVTLAGKCCESGDLLGEDMALQECAGGDVLAVLCTGAYNYSMASRYNRTPFPAVVFVRDGKARLVVRRETLEDLTRCDL